MLVLSFFFFDKLLVTFGVTTSLIKKVKDASEISQQ